jgi:LysM repeat protein/murein endopeptidase
LRALAIFAVALGALQLGCAEVRPPTPNTPSASGGGLQGSALPGDAPLGGAAEPGAEPAAFENGAFEEGEEPAAGDEDVDQEDLEEDHDETSSLDFMACLDRGPGQPPHCPQFTWKSPLEGLSASEVELKVKADLASIGPISIGAPNRGLLFNGVRMPDSEYWTFTDPGHAYGTQETVDSIARAIEKVNQKHKDTPKTVIGHLSAKGGGYLKPHKSHQAGRDVDLSYFYTSNVGWYAYATDKNLDRLRTWTFVKAFLEDPNTEMVLIDTSVQRLLYDYALAQNEDKAFLDRVFQVSGKSAQPLIRHVKGHQTHIHVRFFSPSAQASGKLAQAYLPKPAPPPVKRLKGKIAKGKPHPGAADGPQGLPGGRAKDGGAAKKAAKEDETFFFHRAKSGDTLDSLARKYGVSIEAIRQANALKGNELKQKKSYRIPRQGSVASSAPTGSGKGGRSHK